MKMYLKAIIFYIRMCMTIGHKWNITYNMGVNRYYDFVERNEYSNNYDLDAILNNVKKIDTPLWETIYYVSGSILSSALIIAIICELSGKNY